MKTLKLRFTLMTPMLGSQPNDKEIYSNFIASNAPDAASREEEIENYGVQDMVDRGTTVFARDAHGNICLWDYQIKGFCKDSCGLLQRAAGKDPATGKRLPANESSKLKAYRKEIDGLIFPKPRMIPIHTPNGIDDITTNERSLTANTPQGQRTALARSEQVPEGSFFEVAIIMLRDDMEKAVLEWCDYSALHGFGQWRNAGWGCASYEVLPDDYPIKDGNGIVVA